MPKMKSQHWLFGILGLISLGSVLYTAIVGDIGLNPPLNRKVESQHSIDVLTGDMKRLMQSISNWQAFCENPHDYLKSASSHGVLAISLRDQWTADELSSKSGITREAIGRCLKAKHSPHSTQSRLCLTVKDTRKDHGEETWFDDEHLLEVSVEFREKGSKLVANCKNIAGRSVEMQSFFSAYTDHGMKKRADRVSGGLRLPLESTRL